MNNIEKLHSSNIGKDVLNDFDSSLKNALIMDDMMNEIGNQTIIANLFTKVRDIEVLQYFQYYKIYFQKGNIIPIFQEMLIILFW